MILKEYDIGWGTVWPTKQLEQNIVTRFLQDRYHDNSRSVIINSVWYTKEYHQKVVNELMEIKPSHIFVVALLDPPVVQLDWFSEFNCEVVGIGYYPGPGFIDYFAIFTDEFHQSLEQSLLLDSKKIDTAYMCLNRKPHRHRQNLYQSLKELNLLDQGFVSMGGDPPERILVNDAPGQAIAPNPGIEQYGIENDIASLGNIEYWQRHFVNIVTETIWDIEPSNFLSEKTFKPIVGLRPFLIYAPNGGENCLLSRGFESYVDDFNDITDIDLKQPYNVSIFVKELCSQPRNYWQMKFDRLQDKLKYNQQTFKNYVQQLQK